MVKIYPLKIDSEKTSKSLNKTSTKKKKRTRTSHRALYAQASEIPEMLNIIVTEREIGAMRRKMERQYKRLLPEIELEAIVRAEKLSRRQIK